MKHKSVVLLVYKPKGISSFEFLMEIKRHTKVKKIGHAGTLDTNASGLMVILLNEATKETDKFLKTEKEYTGLIKFHKTVERDDISKIFKRMEGRKMLQTPPKKSAVARKPRKREINSLKILDFDGKTLKFRIACEAGFYIRKFASDIGAEVGVNAHLAELKRIRSGRFDIKGCCTLEELKRENISINGLKTNLNKKQR